MTDKAIARSLSVLFHPVLYPIYGFLLLFFFDNQFIYSINIQIKLYVLGLVFFNTLVLPVFLLWFFKERGIISSMKLGNREERFYPLITSFLFYITTWYLVGRLQMPSLYTYILALSTILTALAIFINLFYKISLHSMGAAAFSSALLSLSFVYNIQINSMIVVVFLLTGLISSSRLILKVHLPSQVYFGLFAGVFASIVGLMFII